MSNIVPMNTSKFVIFYVFLFVIVFVLGIFLGKQSYPENPSLLIIQQDIEVERKIMPDTFYAELIIKGTPTLSKVGTLSPKEQNDIRNTLNAINELVFEAKDICSGGSFSLAPSQSYEEFVSNGKLTRTPVYGYLVNMRVACEFKESSKATYETFLNKTTALVEQNPYLQHQIPQISPIITRDQIREKTQDMRDEILTKAKQTTKNYGDILKTKCTIADMRFNDARKQPIMQKQARYEYAEYDEEDRYSSVVSNIRPAPAAMPVAKEDEITLSASFSINCER